MIEIQTLVADPPWKFGDKLPGASRGAAKNYATMSAGEIMGYLPRLLHQDEETTFRLAPDCRLFLWRVASMQQEALDVMKVWGFTLKAEIVWCKKTVKGNRWFGMGHQVRMEHEVCLIGTSGRPQVLNRSTRSLFDASYTRHSGKPDEFFSLVENLSPGPYAELFARTARPNWLQFGNELPQL